jgi:hypothetical protein
LSQTNNKAIIVPDDAPSLASAAPPPHTTTHTLDTTHQHTTHTASANPLEIKKEKQKKRDLRKQNNRATFAIVAYPAFDGILFRSSVKGLPV